MNLRRQPVSRTDEAVAPVSLRGDGRAGFGALLRALRLQAGLAQEALAERARLSVVTIGALERGRRSAPYPETLAKLAGALRLNSRDRGKFEAAAGRPPRPRRRPVVGAMPRTTAPPSVAALQIVSVIAGPRAGEALVGCIFLVEPALPRSEPGRT
jgi:transcriptional regulator with XRE-family HTH domain